MRRATLGACLLLALLGLAPAAAAAPRLPLSHEGRWITDASGRVVVLHGYNMVYKRPPYAPDAIGFSEDDARWLKSEGYNTVRVGIIYGAVEPQPGVYDEAYLERIEATVNMLGRHGIVSLLDFHQDLFHERFQGEGWPEWAVQDDGLPAEPKAGFPGNYLFMPALWRAFDHFWANDPGPGGVGLQDRYAAAWRHVARRFRKNRYVLGYDLLNEPWPGSTWESCANSEGCPVFDAMLTEFYVRVIEAIRQVDRRTVVYYEPHAIFNNGAKTNIGEVGDDQIGFSFHDYCLPAGQSNSDAGCGTFDDMVFANAEAHSQATGAALLLTEFGATGAPDILASMVDRADRNMVSWQEWHYCGCDDPTTVGPGDKQAVVRDPRKPPEGDNLDPDKLAILTRPYPQVVAGTPLSWSFDAASRVFSLEYVTERAVTVEQDLLGDIEIISPGEPFGPYALTEIAVPARTFPNGYVARVEGGSVVSGPGARVLKVAACPEEDVVTVTVAASGESDSSCRAPRRARLRVSLSPRTVPAGPPARVRVRVRGGAGDRRLRPLRRALVKAPGTRARRTDRSGRVRLKVRYARPGPRRIAVRAPGYPRGSATLRVLRRR